jgi:hypothetical protein
MSQEIPEFKCGDRMQAMQTDDNIERGIAACCGVVLEKKEGMFYRCFLEKGDFLLIPAYSMNHISEETYYQWKTNKVETAKSLNERL